MEVRMLTAHRLLITLIMWAIALQFFLAGAGAFGATDFHWHKVVGTAIVPAALLALGAAALARAYVRQTAIFFGLVVLQFILGRVGFRNEPWVGAFHGLNALGVAAVGGSLAGRVWASRRGERASPPARPAA
jgi:Family of unknown function (DUF6220)